MGSRVSGRRDYHPKLTCVWFKARKIAKVAILLGASGKSSILKQKNDETRFQQWTSAARPNQP